MEHLKETLNELMQKLPNRAELENTLEELISVYPFNEFEYIIAHLLSSSVLSLATYNQMRTEYIDRNLYLHLYEISAPRGFGELWAQGHLKELVPTLERPNKQLDAAYSGGEYDFILPPNIRIEVKASRAVEFNINAPLYAKALASDSTKSFDMNFQQIKPQYCDVFVWIGVWRDTIKFWVLPSSDVESSPFYSKGQHRGNIGEGQLHFNQSNISLFDTYIVQPSNLEASIRAAFSKERQQRGIA